MAHLWVKDDSAEWAVLALDGQAFTLGTSPPRPLAEAIGQDRLASSVVLMRAGGAGGSAWVLVAGSARDVRVNGAALSLGIRVMKDRDEIRIRGTGTLFFSTESLARVEPFKADGHRLYCPRCKQQIEEGTSAVRCPGCAVWYHQDESLPCWTYSEVCALCPQQTSLDAGYRWTPEGF
jgi:hypothetical protein